MNNQITEQYTTSGLFNTIQLLQAYEQAIDENIISSITDTKGIIIHANRKFCEVSQYSVDEIIGKSHAIINSGYHPAGFFKNMWHTIAKGNVWHDDIRNKAKDGTYYWVDTVVVPIKDEDGKNTHYLSLRSLITGKKDLEKKNEQYLSSLEVLLVMTSNNIKKPLSDCLDQLNKFDPKNPSSKDEMKSIIDNLQSSVSALNNFSNELSTFIREIER